MSTSTFAVDSLAQAIAREEGFNAGSVGTSANNPGDLELGDVGYGTITAAGGNKITVFGSLQDGWNALTNMLTKDVTGGSSVYTPNESINDFMTTYSGGNPNAGQTTANILGVPASTPISTFGGTPIAANSSVPAPSVSSPSLTSGIGQVAAASLPPWIQALLPKNSTDGSFYIPSVTDIVIIIVGLILLAGAVYGFKNLTTTIIMGTKKGAEIAAG